MPELDSDGGPQGLRPLAGRAIVVCRPAVDAEPIVRLLFEEGAEPIRAPLQETGPPLDGGRALEAALARLGSYRWLVLTSVNGVRAISGNRAKARPDDLRVAAVGRATAKALAAIGYEPDLVPERASAADLVDCFEPAGDPGPLSVLAPLAELASDDLVEGLERKGYQVDRVEAYRMIETSADPDLEQRVSAADTVIFSSPSAVDAFLARFGRPKPGTVVACIGPRTGARAGAQGLSDVVVAADQSDRGVVDALVAAASGEICR